ncbi:MAG: hypothetical protein HY646_03350, partial [Acidobacteria bacterium]|nr:hypothetical protein [Acidobacteriota bacterium]
DRDGRLVRTLQSGKKQEPGNYQVTWDGKNGEGQDVRPGEYQFRGISSDIRAVYELVAGNPGNPPYKTADGRGAWNGFWGNPVALATDETGLYVQYSMEEGDGSLLKVDFSGRVQWKAHLFQGDGNGYQLALATDGKHVYVAADVGVGNDLVGSQRKSIVWRVAADSGDFALWNGHALTVGPPYESGPVAFWELVRSKKETPPMVHGRIGGANVRGLAIRDGKLYVPLFREDKIEVWDTASGQRIAAVDKIVKPQGVAVDQQGRLYVASRKQIVRVRPDGTVEPAVEKGLSAPYGVAVDGDGSIYVSDLGDSQQVKKFSPSGRLLWTSGRKGGRPFSGKMDHHSFLFPCGLAVDPNGQLYVGEDSPPTRVCGLTKKGRIVREWIGALGIGAGLGIAVDEADPTNVYACYAGVAYCRFSNPLVRFKINYQQKTWQVDAYWWGLAGANSAPGRGGMAMSSPHLIAWGQAEFFVRHRGGNTYLFSGQHWNHPIWRVAGYRLVASACVGQGERMLPVDLDQGYTLDANGNPLARSGNRGFIWRDKNGDGDAGAKEVELFDEPKGLGGHESWGGYIDHELNVYLPDNYGTGNVYKIPCLGLDEKGNPIYSWAKSQVVITAANAGLAECDYARIGQADRAGQKYQQKVQRIHLDKKGNIYGTTEIGGQDKGIGWASSTVDVKVGQWDPQGNLRWKTGIKA